MNYRNTLLTLILTGSTLLTTSCGGDDDGQQQADDNHETDGAAGEETGNGSGPAAGGLSGDPQGETNGTPVAKDPQAQESLNKIFALIATLTPLAEERKNETKPVVKLVGVPVGKTNKKTGIPLILAVLHHAKAQLEGKEERQKINYDGETNRRWNAQEFREDETELATKVKSACQELDKLYQEPVGIVDYVKEVEKPLDEAIAAVPSDS